MAMAKGKDIPLACRYVTNDQWFITHVNTHWKVKHLKQLILAKCLNLSFDPRGLFHDVPGARPPSPITFAPDDNLERSDSPIEFAPRKVDDDLLQDDEDDEWDGIERLGSPGRRRLGLQPPQTLPGGRVGPSSQTTAGSSTTPGASAATTAPAGAGFAKQSLIPTHLHTLLRFSTGQILDDELYLSFFNLSAYELVELHYSTPATSFALQITVFQDFWLGSSNEKWDRDAIINKFRIRETNRALERRMQLAPLKRADLDAYAQPYWEGWVRALRAVPQEQSTSDMATYINAGAGLALYADETPRHKPKLVFEWRDRWLIIKNGYLFVCKTQNDPATSHVVRLSDICNIRGMDHVQKNSRYYQHKSRESAPQNSRRRSTSLPRTNGDRPSTARETSGTSSVPNYLGEGSRRRPATQPSGPPVASSSKLAKTTKSNTGRYETEEERQARELREQELYLSRWSQIGISPWKDKDKGKGKKKEGTKSKDDGKEHRSGEKHGRSREYGSHEDGTKTVTEDSSHQTLRFKRSFIPATRQEAENLGMRILCARFLQPQKPYSPFTKAPKPGEEEPRKYTSTGPSLAGEPPPTLIDIDPFFGDSIKAQPGPPPSTPNPATAQPSTGNLAVSFMEGSVDPATPAPYLGPRKGSYSAATTNGGEAGGVAGGGHQQTLPSATHSSKFSFANLFSSDDKAREKKKEKEREKARKAQEKLERKKDKATRSTGWLTDLDETLRDPPNSQVLTGTPTPRFDPITTRSRSRSDALLPTSSGQPIRSHSPRHPLSSKDPLDDDNSSIDSGSPVAYRAPITDFSPPLPILGIPPPGDDGAESDDSAATRMITRIMGDKASRIKLHESVDGLRKISEHLASAPSATLMSSNASASTLAYEGVKVTRSTTRTTGLVYPLPSTASTHSLARTTSRHSNASATPPGSVLTGPIAQEQPTPTPPTSATGGTSRRPAPPAILTSSPSPVPPAAESPDLGRDTMRSESPLSGNSSPRFAHSSDSEPDDGGSSFGWKGKGTRTGYHYPSYGASADPRQVVSQPASQSPVDDIQTLAAHVQSDPGLNARLVGSSGRSARSSAASSDDKGKGRERRREKGKAKPPKRHEMKGEWLVFDCGSEAAFNSLTRIFHRHFPAPVLSTLVNTASRVPQGNHGSFVSTPDSKSAPPLALPYPEWRYELIERGQRIGMGEMRRPVEWTAPDFAFLHPDEMDEDPTGDPMDKMKKRRFSVGRTRKASGVRPSADASSTGPSARIPSIPESKAERPSGLLDDDDDDDDTDSQFGGHNGEELHDIGDSEEESECEWQAWSADLSRQNAVDRKFRDMQKGAKKSALLSPPPTPAIEFTHPFAGIGENDSTTSTANKLSTPTNLDEDRGHLLDKRSKLEPTGYSQVTSPPGGITAFQRTLHHHHPSHNSLSSPSSSESLYPRTQPKSFSLSGYEPGAPTTPSSSRSHRRTHSKSVSGTSTSVFAPGSSPSQRSAIPMPTLHHSASMPYTSIVGSQLPPARTPTLPANGLSSADIDAIDRLHPRLSVVVPNGTSPNGSGASTRVLNSPTYSSNDQSLLSPTGIESDVFDGMSMRGDRDRDAFHRGPPASLSRTPSLMTKSSTAFSVNSSPQSSTGILRKRQSELNMGSGREKMAAKESGSSRSVAAPGQGNSEEGSTSSMTPPPVLGSVPEGKSSASGGGSGTVGKASSLSYKSMSLLRRVRSGSSLYGDDQPKSIGQSISPSPDVLNPGDSAQKKGR